MDSASLDNQQARKRIVIAGGGLVGALCACIMGRKGHQVDVYESRPDPRSEREQALAQGRSINLALSARGRAALARAGLEDTVISQAIPMRGRMIHSANGSKKAILYDPNTEQCIYSVSRQFLNEILLSEAEKNPNVSLHFSHKLVESKVDKGVVTFRNNENIVPTEVEIESDLIIGADGAHSALRQAMLKRPMTNFSQMYIDHAYMELRIPAKENGQHAMDTHYLHIWPRNEFMLIALPNLDGSFTATLFMPIPIFGELQSAEEVEAFFTREFPDAIRVIGKELLIKDFLSSRPSHLISVKCNPLNAGKGVLVGDAAHAMVPFYGQGMNAGFEDILILDNIFDIYKHEPVEKVLTRFSQSRVPNAHAICELALYNYVEMRCLVNQSVFILRRFLDYRLHKYFGKKWTPLYNNVTFSLTPYSECIQHKKWQDQVMSKVKYASWTVLSFTTLSALIFWKDFVQTRVHDALQLVSMK
ncbi:unnamed protein product [Orchesella dallaii]|uniref:Kynurenine 3-monooxygenase n=1 Tax=Orchesella dallaii TaxID=48710 RepID=A0ABP1RSI3_9HEXA